MAYPVMPLGFLGSQGDNDTYRIERSLRFNSADSANLTRTPSSAGNRKTFTISFWAKRSNLSSNFHFIQAGPDTNTITSFSIGENGSSPDNINLTFFDYQSGSYTTRLISTQVFRDTSSWMHFVASIDTTQSTSSSRVRIYVNGGEINSFSTATYPNQNQDLVCNNNVTHRIGSYVTTRYSDGYITEYNFIDGQAMTPSSFGETDPITGRWKAKAYSGTYGTNGFYLSFKDNTSTTTLGYDDAGSNDWTLNNFSVTAGAGNDSLVDSPTNYGSDTGAGGEVRGNYATLSPILPVASISITNGNISATSSAANKPVVSTIPIINGKWYWEKTITTFANDTHVGLLNSLSTTALGTYIGGSANGFSWSGNIGDLYTNNAVFDSAFDTTFTSGDILGFAFDADSGRLWFAKNGTWLKSSNPATNTSPHWTGLTSGPYFPAASLSNAAVINVNFGQRPFSYTAPSGFKALCTTNLPQPTIQKPSSAMDVVTYTGNGSARSITGLGFSPDLVWIKGRSGATDHAIYDSVRGVQLDLASNLTSAETTQSQGVTAFNSDGFSIGTLAKLNTNTSTYVAWAWDEAPIAGMDIVSYTGNGANRTISHNLGVAPKMIIVRNRNSGVAQNWQVYHSGLTSASYRLRLNTTDAQDLQAGMWNSTAPTSSVFSVGTESGVNENGKNIIAYLFAEVEGFSKFGSYTGTGTTDGAFVWCGFRPRWVIMKRTDTTNGWIVLDTARNTFNITNSQLNPESSVAEDSSFSWLDILSNGFKCRGTMAGNNASGGTYIFAAFAESPFKYARAR